MISRAQFSDRLAQGMLLMDGAMGTMLHNSGAAIDGCFDALNMRDPARVADVHRLYIQAGADIIETNSFGANRFKLGDHGLQERVQELNEGAVKIARRVIDGSFKKVWLAGSVGPLGVRMAPLGRVTTAAAQAAFEVQMAALIYPQGAEGVDIIAIETLTDLYEMQAAVDAVREVSAEIPVIAMLSFTRDDRTLLGDNATRVAHRLAEMDIDAIGVNCSGGPAQLLRLLTAIQQAQPQMALVASPNAGWPEQTDGGRVLYPATPAYFADYARAFRSLGVSIVGGCCGTNGGHIAAMREALDAPGESRIPKPRVSVVETNGRVAEAVTDPPTALTTAFKEGTFVTTVEMKPPKGISALKMLAGAEMLRDAGANFLNVADIPLARMRMSAWAAAYLIQDKVGLETVLHFPTRGRNLLRVQGDLLAAHAMGIRNLFVTMGDPTRIGDYPEAMDTYDIVPTGLLDLIASGFNAGLDKAGTKLDQPTNFLTGCAVSLTPKNRARELRLFNKKVRRGADFAMTQPIFDVQAAKRFITDYETAYGEWKLPVLAGIMPLYNSRNAEFLHNEVPGIHIPDRHRARMASAATPQAEGVKITREVVAELRAEMGDFVQGVYITPAFGRYDLVAQLIEAIG